MSIWEKTVQCLRCGKELQIKSFRLNPGKYIFAQGYLCNACLEAEKQARTEDHPMESTADMHTVAEQPAAEQPVGQPTADQPSGKIFAIASMAASLPNRSQTQAGDLSRYRALPTIESLMTAWFSALDSSAYPAPTVSREGATLAFGDGASATFRAESKELLLQIGTDVKTVTCLEIENISFSCMGNLVKCTETFLAEGESRTSSFLLLKRSVNAEPAAE